MGHANRPRLHDALSLDAQSRRLCLPSARRRWESDTNANSHSYGHTNSDFDTNTNTNSYCYANADFHAQTDADAEVSANTKASSYSAAPPITPDSQEISDGL